MPNQIFCIAPYRLHGTWAFDDHTRGLLREPFVAGIPAIIDAVVGQIANAEQSSFRLLFSAAPFPGIQITLRREKSEGGGAWYCEEQTGLRGWLCPALFMYFDTAPEVIYARCEALVP